jgi:hypothetical protein
MTVGTLVAGPVVAHLCARHPFHRSALVLVVTAASAAVWAVVLAWPGRSPHWLLVMLVLVLALGGPGAVIGFDYARTFNPVHRIGSATGIVNVGGFVASIVLVLAIGVVLDLTTPAGASAPPLSAFRWAFAVQYLLWALGAVQVLRYRNAARRRRVPATDAGPVATPEVTVCVPPGEPADGGGERAAGGESGGPMGRAA